MVQEFPMVRVRRNLAYSLFQLHLCFSQLRRRRFMGWIDANLRRSKRDAKALLLVWSSFERLRIWNKRRRLTGFGQRRMHPTWTTFSSGQTVLSLPCNLFLWLTLLSILQEGPVVHLSRDFYRRTALSVRLISWCPFTNLLYFPLAWSWGQAQPTEYVCNNTQFR